MKLFTQRIALWSMMATVLLLGSCSMSVTNVWDYYVKNHVEHHKAGQSSMSKSKVLYRKQESPNKAQLELIAYKSDSMKCLVIGSHKIAKAFIIYDTLYHFDVNDLYSSVRGNDFIRQMGDLSIYFTHISASDCDALQKGIDGLRAKFGQAMLTAGATSYMDYAVSPEVFVSAEKTSASQQLKEVTLWVGKRKHKMDADDLVKALQDFKSFN